MTNIRYQAEFSELCYSGWNIVQDKDGISMDQRQYCKTILPVIPLPKEDDNEPLSISLGEVKLVGMSKSSISEV